MTEAPKRGRPRKPDALTPAERARVSRQARAVAKIELSADVLAGLDAVARQHGDPSRPAAVARLVREAQARG